MSRSAQPDVTTTPLQQFGLGTLECVAYSPDGNYVATGGSRGAFLWDIRTSEVVRTFVGHRDTVLSVAFSPDGTKLLTGDAGWSAAAAKLWNVSDGTELREFSGGHTAPIESVAFSPDGALVITGSWDYTAKLWDASTGSEIRTLAGHTGDVLAVAFSPDGTQVLTGSNDGTAKLWRTSDGSSTVTFSHLYGGVCSAAFAPDGTKVLTGGYDRRAVLWNVSDGSSITTVYHGAYVRSVAFSPDGTKIMTGGGSANLWNSSDGSLIRTFPQRDLPIESVAFSPDGTKALTGTQDTGELWNVSSGVSLGAFTGHLARVVSFAFSPDGSQLLTGSEGWTATLWSVLDGSKLRRFAPDRVKLYSVAFSPDGTKFLTGRLDKTAVLWSLSDGSSITKFSGHTNVVWSVCFSPDGTQVLTGSSDGTAILWDASDGSSITKFSGHAGAVYSVAFSPDGTKVLTGSGDGTAMLWDASSGSSITAFTGHTDRVWSVAFSPDGTKVLAGSSDMTAILWNASDGSSITAFSGHYNAVRSVAFSPAGTQVLTGSYEKARVWSASDGSEIRTFSGVTWGFSPVAFSPDGTRVATGGSEGAQLWEAPPSEPFFPSGLTATPISSSQVDLSWQDNSANEDGFKIERKTGATGMWAEVAVRGANATSYADSGLAPSTTYFYRVRAYNAVGDSLYSNEASATTFDAPPTPPSILTAAAVSSSQIDLSWQDNSANEDGFKIERKTGAGGTWAQIQAVAANVTSFQSSGLLPDTTYFFRVRAYNAVGNSAYSNEASATTFDTPPAAPTGLTATAVSSSQVNLSWTDNATNEQGFRIERKTGAGGTWVQIQAVGADVTSFQNTGLTPNTTYFYRVRAYNAVGNSPYSNEASATTFDVPPAPPSGLTATAVSSSQVNLSWTDNANNELGFRIERKTGAGGTWTQIRTVGINTTSAQNTGLAPNTIYFYRVRAYNAVGSSAYSNEASATTFDVPPAPPSGLTATAVSSSQINLSWTDNANSEQGFRIERKTGAGGTWAQIQTVGANVTSFQNTGLTRDTAYFYRVRAYNAAGDSAYSNEASATTFDVPPAAPSDLTITYVSATEVRLMWTDNANNEEGFRIDRKTSADGIWAELDMVGANVTAFNDAGLVAGTTYFYRIHAFNAAGPSSHTPASPIWIPPVPRIEAATLSDANANGLTDAGDQLVLTLTRSVDVQTTLVRTSHFFLPVQSDSLGTSGFAVSVNPLNARLIVLTLGEGVQLTAGGEFSTTSLTPGSSSAIDFAANIPATLITSVEGISATDGGLLGVNDTGIDILLSMISNTVEAGPSGAVLRVVDSPDAAYTRHAIRIPPGALDTTHTLRLRPPPVNLGVIGAVQIESSSPTLRFKHPAEIYLQYREGDIDWEGGQLESEMHVYQLVETPTGGFAYDQIPGQRRLDVVTHVVSILIPSLNPLGAPVPVSRAAEVSTIGTFAGIPVDTVDERTISIKPVPPGAIRKMQGGCVATPGPYGAYLLHTVEFPGYEEAAPSDPARLDVTLRTACFAERVSTVGGQSFPSRSGAIVVVEVRNAAAQPVAFTDPVHLTVQFKNRSNPYLSDCVLFNEKPMVLQNMRIVHDAYAGPGIDFRFLDSDSQSLDAERGTITVRNHVGLTGSDGMGVYGAVARAYFTRAGHWSLYR